MIIRGAQGDDEQRVSDMEGRLCRKHRLARRLLYAAIRQADFHETYKDPSHFWTPACYAGFAGDVLTHKLGPAELKRLLEDFTCERAAVGGSWDAVTWDEVLAGRSERNWRDSTAIAHRYACCVADDYLWPDPGLPGKMTESQLAELNDYLAFVSGECLIPACKLAPLACQRQLDDLTKSYGSTGEADSRV